MSAKKMMAMVAVLTTAGMLVAEYAQAVAVPMLMRGTRSVDVSGRVDDDGDDLNINLAGSFGYFIQDLVQVGGFASADMIGSDYKRFGGGAFGEYNLDLGSPVVPYVGVSAGMSWMDAFDDTETVLEAIGAGGVRFFFVDYAAVGVELDLGVATEDIYNRGEDAMDFWLMMNTSWFF